MTLDNGASCQGPDYQLVVEECEAKAIALINAGNRINELLAVEKENEALRDQVKSLVAEIEELRRV